MIIENLHLPEPFRRLIARLPPQPPSFVFTQVLNRVLRSNIARGDLQPLEGKHIAIHVMDIGLQVHFSVLPAGLTARVPNTMPDLSFSATLHDFYLLVTRKEDPDTLFFHRRLSIEGDTELGLIAKNTLDSIELPNLAMLRPSLRLANFRSHRPNSPEIRG